MDLWVSRTSGSEQGPPLISRIGEPSTEKQQAWKLPRQQPEAVLEEVGQDTGVGVTDMVMLFRIMEQEAATRTDIMRTGSNQRLG